MYITDEYLDWVSVEAVDEDGNILGTSAIHRTTTPDNWRLAGFEGEEKPTPTTDDHSLLHGSKLSGEAGVADSYSTAKEAAKAVNQAYELIQGVGELLIFVLIACSVSGLMAGIYLFMRRRHMQAYHTVPSDEAQLSTYGGPWAS